MPDAGAERSDLCDPLLARVTVETSVLRNELAVTATFAGDTFNDGSTTSVVLRRRLVEPGSASAVRPT